MAARGKFIRSEETRRRSSESAKKRDYSKEPETRRALSEAAKRRFARDGHPRTGIKHSEETRKKMSESHTGRTNAARLGKKHTDEAKRIISIKKGGTGVPIQRGGRLADMQSTTYRMWRKLVLERDGKRCTACGAKRPLQVHHIKPYAQFPELRYDADNGLTLCRDCHLSVTYGRRTVRSLAMSIDVWNDIDLGDLNMVVL